MTDTFASWLNAAGRRPLLSEAEVLTHCRAIQGWLAGDIPERIGRRSLNRMIECNLRLVVNVYRRKFAYIGSHDKRALDALQEGALGLRHAITKFDPARGYKFSTYAVNWIYKYMDDGIRLARPVRLSADCQCVVITAKKLTAQYVSKHGRAPSKDWLASQIKSKPVDTVKFYLDRYEKFGQLASLDKSTNDEDSTSFAEMIPARDSYDMELDKRSETLDQVLQVIMSGAGLSDVEKELVYGRFLNANGPTAWTTLERETGINARNAPVAVERCLKRCAATAKKYNLDLSEILGQPV